MPIPDTLTLAYRPDLAVLTVRWLTDSQAGVLRTEYDAVLLAADTRCSPRWLFDVRRRPTADAEATRWVSADWLPRAVAVAAPARLRLAYLVTPARDEFLRLNPPLRTAMETTLAAANPYDVAVFADEGAAMRWLLA